MISYERSEGIHPIIGAKRLPFNAKKSSRHAYVCVLGSQALGEATVSWKSEERIPNTQAREFLVQDFQDVIKHW